MPGYNSSRTFNRLEMRMLEYREKWPQLDTAQFDDQLRQRVTDV